MVRVHLSPPNFDYCFVVIACKCQSTCGAQRLVKRKIPILKRRFKKSDEDESRFQYLDDSLSIEIWIQLRIQKSHLENWTKYARQTRDRTLWHPSLKRSQCFLKRVIIKYNYQRVKKLKSFRGSHKSVEIDFVVLPSWRELSKEQFLCGLKKGQAIKGAGRMPWHWEPMKDVVNCDKPRGAVSRRYIRGFPNGATRLEQVQSTYGE